MACYVEPLANHGWILHGRLVKSCHLVTDDIDLTELHRIAEAAGCKRSWFQDGSTPHYDLTASLRQAAIDAGAVDTSRTEWVAAVRRRRDAIQKDHPLSG